MNTEHKYIPEPGKVTKVTKITNSQNVIFPRVEEFKTEQIRHPQNWGNDISELENYFESIDIPTQPVKLNSYSTITNCTLFLRSHFSAVKDNNGNETFLPYLNRLKELKQVLTINSN